MSEHRSEYFPGFALPLCPILRAAVRQQQPAQGRSLHRGKTKHKEFTTDYSKAQRRLFRIFHMPAPSFFKDYMIHKIQTYSPTFKTCVFFTKRLKKGPPNYLYICNLLCYICIYRKQ